MAAHGAETLRPPVISGSLVSLDPQQHHKYIDELFNKRGAGIVDGAWEGYFWNMMLPVENSRLWFQNNMESARGENWGRQGHFDYHKALAEGIGFNPKTIAVVGAGADATLISNLLDIHKGAEVCVIELDPRKAAQVRETIDERHPDDRSRVVVEAGDVVDVMPRLPEFDMVDTQLLLVHLQKAPPPDWDPSKPFTTIQKAIDAISQGLRHGGIATVSDLAVREWNNEAAPGYEQDPEVQAMLQFARMYVHGVPNGFPGVIEAAWGRRGAHPWKDAGEIAEAVKTHSNNALQKMDSPVAHRFSQETQFQFPEPQIALMTHMPLTIAMQAEAALRGAEQRVSPNAPEEVKAMMAQRRAGVEALWKLGPQYINVVRDPRIVTALPTMHWQAFEKAAQL
jgi:spermidine synthase